LNGERRTLDAERRTLNAETVVLKLGGELLDDESGLRGVAASIAKLASERAVVVIHGGGRAIDAELRARGLEPQFVDGLRVTDAAALDVVVSVLAGRNNTALVAALGAAGCRAVGLTGADAAIGLAVKAPAFTSVAGEEVDLGLVGQPSAAPTALLVDLLDLGYLPVIASIGVSETGELLNVNADTLAGHLAGALHARQLVIAGGTAGVLDADGNGISELTLPQIDELIASRQAHSGMVAKLAACRVALTSGVPEVAIVSGRDVADWSAAKGTRLTVETAAV
jgi:acetylglutamate kinase